MISNYIKSLEAIKKHMTYKSEEKEVGTYITKRTNKCYIAEVYHENAKYECRYYKQNKGTHIIVSINGIPTLNYPPRSQYNKKRLKTGCFHEVAKIILGNEQQQQQQQIKTFEREKKNLREREKNLREREKEFDKRREEFGHYCLNK